MDKIAFATCIQLVLMRLRDTNYHLVLAKLQSYYGCEVLECLEHPEYLKTVLREVYKEDYNSVLNEISVESKKLVDMNEFKVQFLKVMKS